MKKLLWVLMSAVLFLGLLTAPASAENEIKIMANGMPVDLFPAPIMENDRVLVPVRGISQILGADVYWNDEPVN